MLISISLTKGSCILGWNCIFLSYPMRKILTILLLAVYITLTSGVSLNVHYCMGEQSSVAIGHKDNKSCSTCGMDNKGCCHDDFRVVKLTDNHQLPILQEDLQKLSLTPPEPVVDHFSGLPLEERYKLQQDHSPPLRHSLNILYCVFRI